LTAGTDVNHEKYQSVPRPRFEPDIFRKQTGSVTASVNFFGSLPSEPAWSSLLHTGFLLGLFFDPEDGGDVFLLSVGQFSADYAALYPRR
jgi:hypothetical protein